MDIIRSNRHFIRRKKSMLRKKKQRGLMILESLAVFVLFAIALGGVMIWLQGAFTGGRTNEAMSQLAAIQSSVSSIYDGQSTYTGLNTAVIAGMNVLPQKMLGPGNTIKHAFKDDVVIASTADTYTVTMNGIPQDACIKMVTKDLGKNMLRLNTSDHAGGVSKQAYTPANASAQACTSSDVNISWEFY